MEKILIRTYLELYSLNDTIEKWSLKNFENNPPRLYRLQIIDSLMRALEIKCSYEGFKYGEFLFDENKINWSVFKKIVEDNFPKGLENIDTINDNSDCYQFIFEIFLRYRIRFYQLINTKSMVFEASGINKIPLNIFNEIDSKITPEFGGIDSIINYLLNPTNIQFTMEELKHKFNYPTINMNFIDSEWI